MRPPSPPRAAPGTYARSARTPPEEASAELAPTAAPGTTPRATAPAYDAPGRAGAPGRPTASTAPGGRPTAANPPNPVKNPAGPPGRALSRPARAGERGAAATSHVEARPPGRAVVATPSRPSGPVARAWAGAALARISTAQGVVSTRLAERLSERRAAKRRLTLRRLAIVGAAVAVVALLGYVVLASPLLALRSEHVRVSTTGPTVDPDLVAESLLPAAGVPLARLSMAELAGVVEEVPGVRTATVRRAWPGGLAVDVVARVPVAAVPGAGQLMLLDVDGVQVGEPVGAAPDGLPVVRVSPGVRGAASLTAVLGVLGDLPAELLGEIREAGATSPDTVTLRLSDGSRVVWGSSALSPLKLRVLEVLRQEPASVYDISAPSRPVTR